MNLTRLIKTVAKAGLHDLGGIRGFQLLFARAVRIVMYHGFTAETSGLIRHCEIMRRYYTPVSLKSVAESLLTGRSLPRNAVAITVDDGYRDFLLYAQPVFQRYEIPTTVYLVSDFLDGLQWQWWDTISYVLAHTNRKVLPVELPSGESLILSIATEEERSFANQNLRERLKLLENFRRLQICQSLPDLLEVNLPKTPPEKWAPLKWSEVQKLAESGVEFGAHTKTHPILSRIGDPVQLREEIAGSKRRLEEELGASPIHFCYPNGRRIDFDEATIQFVKECGFQTAVTTERGMNFAGTDPLLLRRLAVDPSDPPRYFEELLAGVRKE